MVYPPEDGHPSKYYPGPTCVNFVHAMNAANHYATPPSNAKVTLHFLVQVVHVGKIPKTDLQ